MFYNADMVFLWPYAFQVWEKSTFTDYHPEDSFVLFTITGDLSTSNDLEIKSRIIYVTSMITRDMISFSISVFVRVTLIKLRVTHREISP